MKKTFCVFLYGLLAWSFICGWAEHEKKTNPGLESLLATILDSEPKQTDFRLEAPHLTVAAADGQLSCTLNVRDNQINVTGNGSWSGADINLQLTTSGEISPLLKGLHPKSLFISGNYTLTTVVSGTWGSPIFTHTLTLGNGVVDSLATGAHFEKLTALLVSDGASATLTELTGDDGQGGTLKGSGSILLTEGFPYALSLEIDKAVLAKLDHIAGIFSGKLSLVGNEASATLEGTLAGESVALALNESKPKPKTVEITYINGLEGPPQKQKADEGQLPLTLDIGISAPQNIWISTEDLQSEWKANLKLKGTSATPLVYGSLEMIHGNYMTSGKIITIKEGTISFDGDPIKNATLSVVGHLDNNSIIAEVHVNGPLTNPSLALRSNPPLPQAEILSHLIFGRGLADITAQQSKQLKKSIAELKSMSTGSNILDGIRSRFGIDRIEISRGTGNELEDVSVQIGKYLTKGLYVAFDKGITSPTNRIILEATLRPNLKLQAEISDTAEGELHLKWRHDY